MSDDTTIPLPGGWTLRPVTSFTDPCSILDPQGFERGQLFDRDAVGELAAAMNAAQATVPPSRGDGAAHPGAAGQDAKIITALKIAANDPDVGTHSDAIFDGLHLIARLCEQCATSPARQDGAAGQPVSGSGGVRDTFYTSVLHALRDFAVLERHGALPTGFISALADKVEAHQAAAPTPPATASSGAAVAVSVEEVERLIARNLWLADGKRADLWDECEGTRWFTYMETQKPRYIKLARAAIRSLAAQQDKDGAREAAPMTEAEEDAYVAPVSISLGSVMLDQVGSSAGSSGPRYRYAVWLKPNQIRALKTAATANQPGREGEGSKRRNLTATESGLLSKALLASTTIVETLPSPAPRQDGEPEVGAHPYREQGRDTTEQEDGRHD